MAKYIKGFMVLFVLVLTGSLLGRADSQELNQNDLKSGWAYSDKAKLEKCIDNINSSQGYGSLDYEKLLSEFYGGSISENVESGFYNPKFPFWVVIYTPDGEIHEKLIGSNNHDHAGDDSGNSQYEIGSTASHEILNQQTISVLVFVESQYQILNASSTDKDNPTPTPVSNLSGPLTLISPYSGVTWVNGKARSFPAAGSITLVDAGPATVQSNSSTLMANVPGGSSGTVSYGSLVVQVVHDVLGNQNGPLDALFQGLALAKATSTLAAGAAPGTPTTIALQEIAADNNIPSNHLYFARTQFAIAPGTYNRCAVEFSWPVTLQTNGNISNDNMSPRDVCTVFADEFYRDWQIGIGIANTHSGDFFSGIGQDFNPNLDILFNYFLTGQYQTPWDSSALTCFFGFQVPNNSAPTFPGFDLGLGFDLGANPFHTGINLNGLGLFLGVQMQSVKSSTGGQTPYNPKWLWGLDYLL